MTDTAQFYCRRNIKTPFRDVIYHDSSGFKMQVFNLQSERFIPDGREVHFFGDNHGDILAFESIGYNNHNLSLVTAAIRWYADYLEYGEMTIYKHNPIHP
jgi:hypothetical protein